MPGSPSPGELQVPLEERRNREASRHQGGHFEQGLNRHAVRYVSSDERTSAGCLSLDAQPCAAPRVTPPDLPEVARLMPGRARGPAGPAGP